MKSTFTLAVLLTALLCGTAAATPSLKGDITVDGAVVTIGDIFDDAGPLAGTAIFRAPAPGTTGIVPLPDLERAASLAGLTNFDAGGRTVIHVGRSGSVVDAGVLDGLIAGDLARRGIVAAGITADIRFDVTGISINAASSGSPASLLDLRYLPGNGRFSARFAIAGSQQPVELSGRIDLMTQAPRLRDTVATGTVLTAADFEMVPVPLATAEGGGYAELDQLVGKQLLRQSRGGIMLKPSDVGEPMVVTRNSLVTVVLHTGAMTLTVRGTALGTVAPGEAVDVLNPASKKILHGIARADGTVEIPTAVTVAGL